MMAKKAAKSHPLTKIADDGGMMVAVGTDVTDEELRGMIVSMTPIMRQAKRGVLFFVTGYDDDPRELWQIPEVASLCKRLVAIGFISLLVCQLPESVTPGGWTAWDVVRCARNEIAANRTTKEEFFELIGESNAKCERILADALLDEALGK